MKKQIPIFQASKEIFKIIRIILQNNTSLLSLNFSLNDCQSRSAFFLKHLLYFRISELHVGMWLVSHKLFWICILSFSPLLQNLEEKVWGQSITLRSWNTGNCLFSSMMSQVLYCAYNIQLHQKQRIWKYLWGTTQSRVCCWTAYAPCMYLALALQSVSFCWWRIVLLLHGQGCCHVGPAALTASLLLKDFQCFSFNTKFLQLICTISWTKRDHNSQGNDAVLAGNHETQAPKCFSRPCSPTFVHELQFADGECYGIAGAEPQERRVPPAELKGCTGGEGGGNEATLLWRSGTLQERVRGEEAACCDKGEPAHPQKKKRKKKKSPALLVSTDEAWGWSIEGCRSSRECICENPKELHNL